MAEVLAIIGAPGRDTHVLEKEARNSGSRKATGETSFRLKNALGFCPGIPYLL
jgi:hypothetical protein